MAKTISEVVNFQEIESPEMQSDLANMPGYLFRVLENKTNSLILSAIRDSNVTPRQYGVLAALMRHGPMTQTELAERTSSDKSTLGVMVARMKENGLLTRRRGEDRRSMVIAVTEKGLNLAVELTPAIMAAHSVILEKLPEEYRLLFMKCLKTLAVADFGAADQADQG